MSPSAFPNTLAQGATGPTGPAGAVGADGAGINYETRSTNTMLALADNAKTIDITAAITQTFDNASNLGAGWWVIIRCKTTDGSSFVTLDPASSETIDGASTHVLLSGESRLVMCSGSAFTTILLHSGVGAYVTKSSSTNITATVEASSDTVSTMPAVVLNGTTQIEIVLTFPRFRSPGGGTNRTTFAVIFDDLNSGGAASIGRITGIASGPSADIYGSCYGRIVLTPAQGSHVYSLRGFVTAGTGELIAGTGGSGAEALGVLSVRKLS